MLTIISGGQTGADVAGLWVAKHCGVCISGWAPKGYETLNGPKPEMHETFGIFEHHKGYRGRTIENLKMSTLTLVFVQVMSAGSRLTIDQCKKNGIPHRIIHLDPSDLSGSMARAEMILDEVKGMINKANVLDLDFFLNIAGNSTNNSPRMFEFVFKTGLKLLTDLGYRSDVLPKDYSKYQDTWS